MSRPGGTRAAWLAAAVIVAVAGAWLRWAVRPVVAAYRVGAAVGRMR